MKIMTAEEAREMARQSADNFITTYSMRRVLSWIKRQAKRGYFSTTIEVWEHDRQLIITNLEKLGYIVITRDDHIEDRYYLYISWELRGN